MIGISTLSGPKSREAANILNSGDRTPEALDQLEALAQSAQGNEATEIGDFIEAFYADDGDILPAPPTIEELRKLS